MKDRADKVLDLLGLVKSRSQARLYIEEGKVFVDGKCLTRPSQMINVDSKERIVIRSEYLFVGRGAYKLKHAYDVFALNFEGKILADIGASTGGFTEFCLMKGARKVYAIDVGHGQLDEKLQNDSRVVNMEGINIKDGVALLEKIDHCVVDLSFISLKKVLGPICDLMTLVELTCLYKPQFEVGISAERKKGILKNQLEILDALLDFYKFCESLNLGVDGFTKSPIKGKDGNIEYLFHLRPKNSNSLNQTNIEQIFLQSNVENQK